MDDVVLTIAGVKHWLWRAVDQSGMVLDILVQIRRDTRAAQTRAFQVWAEIAGVAAAAT